MRIAGLACVVIGIAAAPACLARFELGSPSAGETQSDDASDTSDANATSDASGASTEESGASQGETSETEGDEQSEGAGDCGEACDPLVEICDAGDCTCRPEFVRCSGMCVELDSDPLHCGECSQDCSGDEVCDDGECRPDCTEQGATACAGACVELDSSPLHCGACAQPCLGDELCVESECVGYALVDCDGDSDCGAGVCCEVDGEGASHLCVDGDQCP